MYYTILYCIVLYCIVLYYIVLHCIVLYYIVLYCIILYYIVLYCIMTFNYFGFYFLSYFDFSPCFVPFQRLSGFASTKNKIEKQFFSKILNNIKNNFLNKCHMIFFDLKT